MACVVLSGLAAASVFHDTESLTGPFLTEAAGRARGFGSGVGRPAVAPCEAQAAAAGRAAETRKGRLGVLSVRSLCAGCRGASLS